MRFLEPQRVDPRHRGVLDARRGLGDRGSRAGRRTGRGARRRPSVDQLIETNRRSGETSTASGSPSSVGTERGEPDQVRGLARPSSRRRSPRGGGGASSASAEPRWTTTPAKPNQSATAALTGGVASSATSRATTRDGDAASPADAATARRRSRYHGVREGQARAGRRPGPGLRSRASGDGGGAGMSGPGGEVVDQPVEVVRQSRCVSSLGRRLPRRPGSPAGGAARGAAGT